MFGCLNILERNASNVLHEALNCSVGMMLRATNALTGSYPGPIPGSTEDAGSVQAGDYSFPVVQADNLTELDRIMRPLCDQGHQMFGRNSSPCFNHEGTWVGPTN